MSRLANLKTSSEVGVKDVSLPNSGGVITRGTVIGDSDIATPANSAPSQVRETAMKAAGVKSHPELMQAHQAGSITAKDHEAGKSAGMDEIMGKHNEPAPATYTAKQTSGGTVHGQPPTGGAVYEGGRSNPSNTAAYRDHSGQIKTR